MADEWVETCTRVFFGNQKIIQPAFRAGTEEDGEIFIVCQACSTTCFLPDRVTPALGVCGQAFACRAEDACNFGHGTYLFEERVQQPDKADGEIKEDLGNQPPPPPPAGMLEQARLAALRQPLPYRQPGAERAMLGRLQSGMRTAARHEDPAMWQAALAQLPAEELRARAAERALTEGDALARELLRWFKRAFSWVNKPPCERCPEGRGGRMVPQGMATPTDEERAWGAGRVELYRCGPCGAPARFPRINHPGKLMETKRGRCGEWANAFTLCCRAMGLEARYVMDWTDHVWTEIWSDQQGRWLHADSCEEALDKPLMYEQGWGKKVTYVVAFGRTGIVDVTRRYTRNLYEVLYRRGGGGVLEGFLAHQIKAMDDAVFSGFSAKFGVEQSTIHCQRKAEEQTELTAYETASFDITMLSEEERRGRISGDAAWKAARGEDGGSGVRAAGAPPAGSRGGGDAAPAAAPWVPLALSTIMPEPSQSQKMWAITVEVTSVANGDRRAPSSFRGKPPDHRHGIIVEGLAVGRGGSGHNVVVVDPFAGVITHSENFQCQRDDGAASAMAAFISSVPTGHIVIIAVQRASTGKMTPEACSVLESLGAPPGDENRLLPGAGARAWALLARKGPCPPAPWAAFATAANKEGPARLLARVPVWVRPAAAMPRAWITLRGQACAGAPHCSLPPAPAEEGGPETPQAAAARASALVETDTAGRLVGVCLPPEGVAAPPLLLGAAGAARLAPSAGWETRLLAPAAAGCEEQGAPAAAPSVAPTGTAESEGSAPQPASHVEVSYTGLAQDALLRRLDSRGAWAAAAFHPRAGGCHGDTRHFVALPPPPPPPPPPPRPGQAGPALPAAAAAEAPVPPPPDRPTPHLRGAAAAPLPPAGSGVGEAGPAEASGGSGGGGRDESEELAAPPRLRGAEHAPAAAATSDTKENNEADSTQTVGIDNPTHTGAAGSSIASMGIFGPGPSSATRQQDRTVGIDNPTHTGVAGGSIASMGIFGPAPSSATRQQDQTAGIDNPTHTGAAGDSIASMGIFGPRSMPVVPGSVLPPAPSAIPASTFPSKPGQEEGGALLLVGLRVWSGSFVNALQCIYSCRGYRFYGPKQGGSDGDFVEHTMLLQEGERVVELGARHGALLDALWARTSAGREGRWGGGGGGEARAWPIPEGEELVGFHGGCGGHIHYLAPITLRANGNFFEVGCSNMLLPEPEQNSSLSFSAVNAVEDLIRMNSLEEAKDAVETAGKYVANILRAPGDPKFRRIKVANPFFGRHLGSRPGGAGLLRALGFEAVVSAEDGELYLVLRADRMVEGHLRCMQGLAARVAALKEEG